MLSVSTLHSAHFSKAPLPHGDAKPAHHVKLPSMMPCTPESLQPTPQQALRTTGCDCHDAILSHTAPVRVTKLECEGACPKCILAYKVQSCAPHQVCWCMSQIDMLRMHRNERSCDEAPNAILVSVHIISNGARFGVIERIKPLALTGLHAVLHANALAVGALGASKRTHACTDGHAHICN